MLERRMASPVLRTYSMQMQKGGLLTQTMSQQSQRSPNIMSAVIVFYEETLNETSYWKARWMLLRHIQKKKKLNKKQKLVAKEMRYRHSYFVSHTNWVKIPENPNHKLHPTWYSWRKTRHCGMTCWTAQRNCKVSRHWCDNLCTKMKDLERLFTVDFSSSEATKQKWNCNEGAWFCGSSKWKWISETDSCHNNYGHLQLSGIWSWRRNINPSDNRC